MGTHREVRVKICGLTNAADAAHAARAGADFLGFIFARFSKRYVPPTRVAEILSDPDIAGKVNTVGVFVDYSPDEINSIVAQTGITHAQIYNAISDDAAKTIHAKIIRVIRVKAETDIQSHVRAYTHYDHLLFDTHVEEYGGAGKRFNWNMVRGVPGDFFLAGGLTPENVREAIETASPFAVDVASGVEREAGLKDPERVQKFIDAAKSAQVYG